MELLKLNHSEAMFNTIGKNSDLSTINHLLPSYKLLWLNVAPIPLNLGCHLHKSHKSRFFIIIFSLLVLTIIYFSKIETVGLLGQCRE